MSESMWAKYLNECGLLNIYETTFGFITFHISMPDSVFVNDMYVLPEDRHKGLGQSLLKHVIEYAQKYDLAYVKAYIHKHGKTQEQTVAASKAAGFQIMDENDKMILLAKEVRI